MEDYVSKMSNMTCVLREMGVLDTRNKIDVAGMKAMANEKFKVNHQTIPCISSN